MAPVNQFHAKAAAKLSKLIGIHIEKLRLGEVYVELGCVIERDPDTVRAPDVAFIRAERVPDNKHEGYFVGAPDLVVEVVSPTDRPKEIQAKIAQWLQAGARLAWVVWPRRQAVEVHAPGAPVATLVGDVLDGGDVLPGFRCPLAELFE